MQLTILRMISNGSLSAFSASVAQSGMTAIQGAAPVQRIRSQSSAPQTNGLSGPAAGRPMPPPTQPGQVLPRGSLLDLSV
jgi:hypothetical protein